MIDEQLEGTVVVENDITLHSENIDIKQAKSDTEKSPEVYENKEFSDFVDEELHGLPSHIERNTESNHGKAAEISKDTSNFTKDEAMGMAEFGLDSTIGMLGELTGTPVVLHPLQKVAFCALSAPCITKYSKQIKSMLDGMEFDDDSLIPEAMLAGGVAVVAPTIYKSVKASGRAKKAQKEAVTDGAESE